MATVWLRLDADIDKHPDIGDIGPWGLVAFTTLLRLVKEMGWGGSIPEKYVTGRHLARRSLFAQPEFIPFFDEAIQAMLDVGLIVRRDGEVFVPGWKKFQDDNAERQASYRARKRAGGGGTPDGGADDRASDDENNACVTERNARVTESNEGDACVTERNEKVTLYRDIYRDKDKKQQQPPPTPSVAGPEQAAAAAAPLSDSCPPEPTSSAETSADETLDLAADVVQLWNAGPAAAGCPACADVAVLTPATRSRLAELHRRHGPAQMREVFARVTRSQFLTGRAKVPTTLQRVVAPRLWEQLLSGAYDDGGRAGPAAGHPKTLRNGKRSAFAGLDTLRFPDEETRRWALDPMNGLDPDDIRKLALPEEPEEQAS